MQFSYTCCVFINVYIHLQRNYGYKRLTTFQKASNPK